MIAICNPGIKKLFCIALLSVLFSASRAQTTEDSVKAAVNMLFDGMKNSDPAAIKNSFADSAVLQSIALTKEGKTVIKDEKVNDFATSLLSSSKP